MPKFKLAVFDIDDTLAEINKPIPSDVIALMNDIYNQGTILSLASGKPTDNVHGLVRQTGLQDVIVIGENGYVTYYGGKFPPDEIIPVEVSENDHVSMQELKVDLGKQSFIKDKDSWVQPITGYINFTFKNGNIALRDEALAYFSSVLQKYDNMEMFQHSDSIEIVIKGINKGTTIRQVCKKLGITTDDVVAIGNGENDVPMFKVAGYSLGVNLPEKFHGHIDKHFTNIIDLLAHIIEVNK